MTKQIIQPIALSKYSINLWVFRCVFIPRLSNNLLGKNQIVSIQKNILKFSLICDKNIPFASCKSVLLQPKLYSFACLIILIIVGFASIDGSKFPFQRFK